MPNSHYWGSLDMFLTAIWNLNILQVSHTHRNPNRARRFHVIDRKYRSKVVPRLYPRACARCDQMCYFNFQVAGMSRVRHWLGTVNVFLSRNTSYMFRTSLCRNLDMLACGPKWHTLCRRHVQMYFIKENYGIFTQVYWRLFQGFQWNISQQFHWSLLLRDRLTTFEHRFR